GFIAPGRRVGLGLHSAVPEEFTPQARTLFRAAATWSLGLPVDSTRARTAPIIARNPDHATVFAGQIAEFVVDARGTEPLTYQWQRGTNNIADANTSILRFPAVITDNGANFRVLVTNDLGTVTSSSVSLTVLPDDGKKILLAFSEGTGTTTTNLGNLGGSGRFAIANEYPRFSSQVPTGPFAPPNNTGSLDFGIIEEEQGGRAADFTNPFGGGIGSYTAITISGWLNVRDIIAGPEGNRIAFAARSIGGPGFDLAQTAEGSLSLGVNQAPGASISSPVITADPNASPNNWIFFAVTYDSSLASGNLSFYFGSGAAAAALDVTLDYLAGPIETTGQLALGNLSAVDLNRNARGPENSRVLRGLIDEVRIFRSALSLTEIQAIQKVPISIAPVAPVSLSAAVQGSNVVISWPANGNFQLESREQVVSGAWTDVPGQPTLSAGRYSVIQPIAGDGKFYRLRGL
ncbi:MAG: LamG-like jellyroll fold domain-containing protein, partial [Bryobacteraceae bacterium]|nr:LamG-like jellyroll fold domain-containing protein [Bryobacteraceae bacterium]